MKVHTVNVIEMIDNGLRRITSFTDDKDGNIEAEELFTQIALENGAESEDMESHLDDGFFEKGYYILIISHSFNA